MTVSQGESSLKNVIIGLAGVALLAIAPLANAGLGTRPLQAGVSVSSTIPQAPPAALLVADDSGAAGSSTTEPQTEDGGGADDGGGSNDGNGGDSGGAQSGSSQ